MRTIAYVDGFNLYYRCLKKTPYKWLNLRRLCELLLPEHHVVHIKYFTARVSPRGDSDQPHRQAAYLRALRTLPNLTIYFGHFSVHTVSMPLAVPNGMMRYANVLKTEEKGSDVNIASHMLHDAHLDRFDTAAVISNDSDLATPLELIRNDLGKGVCLLNPQDFRSMRLSKHATLYRRIRDGVLSASQFPEVLHDSAGEVRKPSEWR